VFKEVMKALLYMKNGEISLDKLVEAYIYTDPKRVKIIFILILAKLTRL
jgi:hypothetical protein